MRKNIIFVAIAGAVVIGGLYLAKTSTRTTLTSPTAKTGSIAANPQDVAAGLYQNKITNVSTNPGLVIEKTEVENIIGSDGKPQSDHLQITVQNTTTSTLSGLEAYYTILDTKTQQKEGYYHALEGLAIPAGQTAQIVFDGKTGVGHYAANPSSLFYTSPNKLQLDVEVSARGVAPQHTSVTKDAGGAEKQD